MAIWDMHGTTIIGGGDVADPGTQWTALGAGDYYGFGSANDILFQANSGAAGCRRRAR